MKYTIYWHGNVKNVHFVMLNKNLANYLQK